MSEGLLTVSEKEPFDIWEIYYRGNSLRGKKMLNAQHEIFGPEKKLSKKLIDTLNEDPEVVCKMIDKKLGDELQIS